MKRIVFWVLLLGGLVVNNNVSAQWKYEEYTKALNGAQNPLNVGDVLTVTDVLLADPGAKPAVTATNDITNIVSLAFNEQFQPGAAPLPDTCSITVRAKISVSQNDPNIINTTTRDFTITYSKDNPYKKNDVFYFTSGRSVKVEIIAIDKSNIDVQVAKTLIVLTNDLRIDRNYDMNCTDCGLRPISGYATGTNGSGGLVNINWSASKWAKAYDLEWTYISSQAYADNRYGTSGTAAFAQNVFRNNATRVTVKDVTYSIPLLFNDNGYVFFRYRAVQELADGQRLTSKWSSEYDPANGLGSYYYIGHENNLNWKTATSFAEEGKRKSVAQYYDGTLRERQTVTADNTTNRNIVGETLYDNQGRPAITVLPAPTIYSPIRYLPTVTSLNAPGSEYTKDLYDGLAANADYCNGAAPGMGTDNGASQYYSPANPDKNTGINKFIPDAKTFPFSETKYTQDNTGRIAAQGGVGESFRLGSSHETKYYYGSASQMDLDALFGTEVGDASHYQKNMVRDANGQYSISYMDMKGRTVATALAGAAPPNVSQLDSYAYASQTESLLTPVNNISKDNSIVFSRTLLVPQQDTISFTYSLNPQTLTMANWNNQPICYDCLYDLTITIADECNNQNMPDGKPFVYTKSNFSLDEINSNCADPSKGLTQSFDVVLPEGSYTITKELSISQYGKNYYRDNIYMPNNSKTTFQDIYNQQMTVVKQQLGDCSTNGQFTKAPDYEYYRQAMYDQMEPRGPYEVKYNRPLRPGEELSMDDAITNHPEFNVYQNYKLLTASNDWDDAMNAVTTYDEAVQKGYLNPLTMGTPNAQKFASNGNADPFFAGIGQRYKGQMTDSINRAVVTALANGKPSAYADLWSLSNMMAKCGLVDGIMDKNCINTYSNSANVFNTSLLCPTELDDAWNKFKTIYLAKKGMLTAAFLFSVGHPVVDDNFRIFPDPRLYINKDSLKGVDPYPTDPVQLTEQAKAALQSSVDANCRAYADYWWSKLEAADCGFDKAKDYDNVISRLVEVCKAGGDATHPLGASTIKPGATASFRSFNDAIIDYAKNNADRIVTDVTICNGTLIDAPGPYEKPFISVNEPVSAKPTDCECKNISGLYQVYNSTYKSKYPTMSSFMKSVYKTNITDGAIDSLRRMCNDELKCTRIPMAVILPPVLQCGNVQSVCADCEKVNNAFSDFKSAYFNVTPTSDEDTAKKNIFFAGYMNDRTGLGKTATDYLNFIDQCNKTPGAYAGSVDVVDSASNCMPDVITFPSTGVPKPTWIDCSDLINAYQNFIVEFPNHTKGATVHMYVFGDSPSYLAATDKQVLKQENNSNTTWTILQANDRLTKGGATAYLLPAMMSAKVVANSIALSNGEVTMSGDSILPPPPAPKLNQMATPVYIWRDSVMNGKQLFEWYMSEHLNVVGYGYTYLNFADWLINSCGYKLNQLPWNDTVAVRQDTLQNIWNRFMAKYAADKLSITETIGVPIIKSILIKSNVSTVLSNEDGIVAATWCYPGWFTQRTANTYNLAALPKNANINNATLNLYAYRFYGLFATHFRDVSQSPYMQLQPVKGVYIPARNTFDIQPGNYAGMSAINLPVTNSAQVNSGNPNDFWSNQNYSAQNVTTLVSSMYANIKNTGINYPVQYRLNDENVINSLQKIIQFGGPSCSDASKKSSLNVSYTASRCDVFAAFVNNALGTYMDIAAIKALYASKGKLVISDDCTSAAAGPGCGAKEQERAYLQLSGNPYDENVGFTSITNNFTMEFWAKPTSAHEIDWESGWGYDGLSGQKYAIAPAYGLITGNANMAGAGVSVGTNGVSVYEHSANYMPAVAVWTGDLTDWTHIAVVYTNKQPQIYINGQLVQTGETSIKAGVFPSYGLFGGIYGGMDGYLAEVRIYNNSRTQAQIQLDMNSTTADVNDNNLAAYWPLNEGNGTFLYDASGKGKGLTIENDATWANGTSAILPVATAHAKIYASDLLLCGNNTEPTFMPLPASVLPNACKDSTSMAYAFAQEVYNFRQDSLLGNFDNEYTKKCLSAAAYESLTMTSRTSEYHYTLYYYDQAGNLIKTVPPAGVAVNRDPSWLALVAQKRAAGGSETPLHKLYTLYRYNSLNQLVSQYSPDGGQTNFWYDKLGRLAVSKNEEQKKNSLYSYTLYDALGRITETGQKQQPSAITDAMARDVSSLQNWINYNNNTYPQTQVTRTVYDDMAPIGSVYTALHQKAYTLRNRVSYTQYFDQLQYAANAPSYLNHDQATYYSYDIHGNVDVLLHDYATGAMAANGYNRFKLVAYGYDLVSGKVNMVSYQPGKQDEMYHRYEYDAENRLTNVYTTHRKAFVGDQNVEEKEASYNYYLHGPLARTVLGNNVQGIDYAYTLQGWLKGVNSTALNPAFDMGGDAGSSSLTAKDAYGFSLNYHKEDYKAINQTVLPFAETGTDVDALTRGSYKALYNGNISNMSVGIKGLGTLLYNYGYDQLNRIRSMDAYNKFDSVNNSWAGLNAAGVYGEKITYDANGNIKSYDRDGNKAGSNLAMDRLTYNYIDGTNKLDHIKDAVPDDAYIADIDSQAVHNYTYDAIGNMTKDSKGGVDKMEWTVYGKVKRVTKSNNITIDYTYDAAGNRISKTLSGSGVTDGPVTTWYVRDAQGNMLTTYTIKQNSIVAADQSIYGSSRLGVINRNLILNSSLEIASSTLPGIGTVYADEMIRGKRQYELTNHLGNVLATISDKKKPVITGGKIDYFEPIVLTATDYYPFGMTMPGRTLAIGSGVAGATVSGTTTVNGYTVPVDLSVTNRSSSQPTEYVASNRVVLEGEVQSLASDEFVAYIADGSYAGTGNQGGGGSSGSTELYMYGFNGKERDNSIGTDVYDYGMRISDSRTGRFFSVDPLTIKYPWLSTYQFGSNRPIDGIDQDGLEHSPAGKFGIYNEVVVDATANTRYNMNPALLQQAVAEAPKREAQRTISAIHSNYSPSVLKQSPVPSGPYEAAQWKASSERQFEAAGYNADGSRPPLMRLADNKTFKNAANNLILPGIEFYGYVDGASELKALYKGAGKLWLGSSKFGADAATLKSFENLKPKKGWFDVVVHGDNAAPGVLFNIDGNPIGAEGLYKTMLENGYNGTDKIRLISCNAGLGGKSSVAQELSNLTNTQVIAPSAKTLVDKSGKFITSDASKYKVFNPTP
ncbi:LamG-like jellyroll fold domain-containing protein [Pinibacter soli]|uniref:RHS repeat-associated core domain-containing protein n=1 Tax=Pinibacter soli TaxID=3044211 RepID=A0ABT6RFS6_9BACT|nr:LamG-like jellyroll fold domain-containing protein [Pinibacter soli]MDI3321388.1 RHS repeat-associated core domain-containing protein [Pinibacter soli]